MQNYLSDNYQSNSITFGYGSKSENDFKIGYNTIPELPENLNRNFKTFYEYVGNPNKEVYINEWTIMSLDE